MRLANSIDIVPTHYLACYFENPDLRSRILNNRLQGHKKTEDKMENTFKTAEELKKFLAKNRPMVTKINNLECNEMYPMIECSNKHCLYYSVELQGYATIFAPFKVTTK